MNYNDCNVAIWRGRRKTASSHPASQNVTVMMYTVCLYKCFSVGLQNKTITIAANRRGQNGDRRQRRRKPSIEPARAVTRIHHRGSNRRDAGRRRRNCYYVPISCTTSPPSPSGSLDRTLTTTASSRQPRRLAVKKWQVGFD